jgi:uncharacterized sulfatase
LNVVFVVADDLNTSLGCYGHSVVKSPHIDRLASRGVLFERAYCQYPVCNPSRASFLSGLRPESIGVVDNVTPARRLRHDLMFLPQYFRAHGYTTIKVGKIFHTGDAFEDPPSWDIDIRETRAAKNPPDDQILRRQGHGGIVLNGEDSSTWDGFVGRKAVELLEAAAGGRQPFFLAVGFRRPHTPYIALLRYFELYPSDQIPLLAEPVEHLAGIPAIALTHNMHATPLAPAEVQPTIAAYFASITFMDAQLGVLLDSIDRHNLWKNTIVVFLSDHGYHLGEHGGLWHKMTLFEEATRVPLIIAAPGKRANVACSQLVELVDLYPTLVELCGLPPRKDLEGISLAPLLRKPDQDWKPAAFTVVSHSPLDPPAGKLDPARLGRSVRTPRWRYTEWFDGSRELYDHQRDPHEYHNLAAERGHADDVTSLHALLERGWISARPSERK